MCDFKSEHNVFSMVIESITKLVLLLTTSDQRKLDRLIIYNLTLYNVYLINL